jgi:hypothetical protein
MRGVRPGCLLLLALLLGGCLLPTRFATAPCRSGTRREGRLAVLPADITVFTSPARRAVVKRAGLPGRVARVVEGLRDKGHRVFAAIDVGGRISAGQGETRSRVHPEDVRALRIALYHQAERMVRRRAATSRPPLAVDPQLAQAVARPGSADALLYIYVTAWSRPAGRVTAGDVAKAMVQYVAAIGASIAVGALIGGLSVKLTPRSMHVDWSARNLHGKRVSLPEGAPRLPGQRGVLGPILVAHSTTPLMDPVPCHSCGPAPTSRPATAGEVDPESREPTFVGTVRSVDSSFIEATLVAASARDGRLLWVARWLHEGDIADPKTSRRLFEHIVEQAPRCGMKLTDWDNVRD